MFIKTMLAVSSTMLYMSVAMDNGTIFLLSIGAMVVMTTASILKSE